MMYQLGSLFETREPRKDLEIFLLREGVGGWAGGKSKPLTLPLDSSLRTQSCCEHSVKKNLENDTANSSS